MGTSERRNEIMKLLCRQKHETISNLADKFGVSTRTIQRDIDILSLTEPIFTLCGKHYGGVYVMEDYSMNRMYMTSAELDVLQKLYIAADENAALLTDDEKNILKFIIIQYSKPKTKKKGIKNE